MHPWFKDIVWDKLYEMEAAFKPEVNGELDTQNFMKFDEVILNSCLLLLVMVFLSLSMYYRNQSLFVVRNSNLLEGLMLLHKLPF